jgi:hypothetical protein
LDAFKRSSGQWWVDEIDVHSTHMKQAPIKENHIVRALEENFLIYVRPPPQLLSGSL